MKPTALLGAVALLAALLLALPPTPAPAQDAFDFGYIPDREFQEGIGPNQDVRIDPDAATLPSDSPIQSWRWVGVDRNGTEYRDRPQIGGDFFITNGPDGIDLFLPTSCLSDDPALAGPTGCPAHAPVVEAYLEVDLQDGGSYRSRALSSDYVDPVMVRALITDGDEITVYFSEPVRVFTELNGFQENPEDWSVISTTDGGSIRVLRVLQPEADCVNTPGYIGRTGCTRVLQLSRNLGEDEEARVQYRQQLIDGENDPFRTVYEDLNGNFIDTTLSPAKDRRRPRLPELLTVDGNTPPAADGETQCREDVDQLLHNDPTPTIAFDNIIDGHRWAINLDGVDVRSSASPVSGTPVTADLTSALADGPHLLAVVAIDRNDNRSDEIALAAPPAPAQDGDPFVCLVIDTVAPISTFAERTPDPEVINVRFSEPLGQVDQGIWTIPAASELTATDVEANADGTQLSITFSDTVPPTADRIRWASGGEDDTYTDLAGNPLAAVNEPLEIVGEALPPLFTSPSAATLAGPSAPVTITGGLNAANTPADVSSIAAQLLVAPDGADDPQAGDVAYNSQAGTWTLDYDFVEDGVHQFTATATNSFGTSDPSVPSARIEWDATAPTVAITSQQPTPGGLLQPDQPAEEPAGGEFLVTLDVTGEPHLRSVTVTLTYDGSSEPAVTRTLTVGQDEGIRATGGTIEVSIDQDQSFIGDATIAASGVDAVGNTSAVVERTISLVDDLDEAPTAVLASNTLGDPRIRLEFPTALAGDSSFNDWEATNGVPDGNDGTRSPRLNGVGQPSPEVVELVFNTPFPALTTIDLNAQPRVSYVPGFGASLQAEDGRRLNVRGVLARDITPPGVPEVTGPDIQDGQAFNLTEDTSAEGADCSTSPPAEGCPGTFTFDVETHRSLDPNFCTVTQMPSPDGSDGLSAPLRLPCGDEEGRVNEDGTFQVTVPVVFNATNTYLIEVEDPAGNPGTNPQTGEPEGVTVTVVEDSIGPVVQRLFAALSGPDVIDIEYGFLPDEAASVDLFYVVGDSDELQPITRNRAVPASGADSFVWNVPDSVDLTAGGLRIVAIGRDDVPNLGPEARVGLSNVPVLRSATAARLDEVIVTISEPVTTDQVDAAGFTILGGPGVVSATPTGTRSVLLALNGDLPTGQTLQAAYNGQGGWAAADGRPLAAGQVPLSLDVGLLPVQDLVAGPNGTGGSVLSWVDELNSPDRVAGYEVSRDGEVIATVDRATRIVGEPTLPDGTYTYSVVTLGQEGLRSDAATVQLTIGDSPVPPGPGGDAVFGGTGAPDDSTIINACEYPARPNITRTGGFVVSCDGRVAVLVQADVADEAIFAKLVRRTAPAADGFSTTTDLYQLVGVTADDFTVVDAFDGFAEFSFRMQAEVIADGTPELITTIRQLRDSDEEQAPRVGRDSVASQIITFGSLAVAQADGRSLRVYGPDPAIAADRFATAAALSQTQFRRAGAAVIARADDYPDALSAAPLAAQVGGPVLLSRTASLPTTTAYELRRLGVSQVIIAGGPAAVSTQVEAVLAEQGMDVTRIGGADRFETSALIAQRVGSVDGAAFLATGLNFADALSASAPAAAAGRPILLTQTSRLSDATADIIQAVDLDRLHIVGGPAAVSEQVTTDLTGLGQLFTRSAGPDRYATSVELAQDLLAEGVIGGVNPLMASGDGDGRTSPDALAAGPIGGRVNSYMLLVPTTRLPDDIDSFLRARPALRGVLMAGGPVAITDGVRALVDATG